MRPPAPHGGPSDNNTPRQPKLSINKKPRPLAGIFVCGSYQRSIVALVN